MQKYLTREGARQFLAEQGVIVAGNGLKDHANRGTGPRYVVINGRALYTADALLTWIAEQANRAPRRRRAAGRAA